MRAGEILADIDVVDHEVVIGIGNGGAGIEGDADAPGMPGEGDDNLFAAGADFVEHIVRIGVVPLAHDIGGAPTEAVADQHGKAVVKPGRVGRSACGWLAGFEPGQIEGEVEVRIGHMEERGDQPAVDGAPDVDGGSFVTCSGNVQPVILFPHTAWI